MRKITYHYEGRCEGQKDNKPSRQYLNLNVNFFDGPNVFYGYILLENFQNLEVLCLYYLRLFICHNFDKGMQEITRLSELKIKHCKFEGMTTTESWNLDNLKYIVLRNDYGRASEFFQPGKEVKPCSIFDIN